MHALKKPSEKVKISNKKSLIVIFFKYECHMLARQIKIIYRINKL
jgi:hypothetical protein